MSFDNERIEKLKHEIREFLRETQDASHYSLKEIGKEIGGSYWLAEKALCAVLDGEIWQLWRRKQAVEQRLKEIKRVLNRAGVLKAEFELPGFELEKWRKQTRLLIEALEGDKEEIRRAYNQAKMRVQLEQHADNLQEATRKALCERGELGLFTVAGRSANSLTRTHLIERADEVIGHLNAALLRASQHAERQHRRQRLDARIARSQPSTSGT